MKNMLRMTTGSESAIPRINRLRLRTISARFRLLCSSSWKGLAAGVPGASERFAAVPNGIVS